MCSERWYMYCHGGGGQEMWLSQAMVLALQEVSAVIITIEAPLPLHVDVSVTQAPSKGNIIYGRYFSTSHEKSDQSYCTFSNDDILLNQALHRLSHQRLDL